MIRAGHAILADLPGFRRLDPDFLKDLGGRLRVENHVVGTVIVREGDQADRLFILESGRAEVTSVDAGGKSCILAVLGPGEMFGELALLNNSGRRQATVTALEPVTLFSLAAGVFTEVLDSQPAFRTEMLAASEDLLVAKFLKQASPFAALEAGQLRSLANRLARMTIEAGAIIVREGAAGDDACYLVRSGKVEVVVGELNALAKQLTTLGPGMLFGESALLTDAPRNATVRALQPTELLRLRRSDLLDAMASKRDVSEQVLGLHVVRVRPRRRAGVEIHQRQSSEGEVITVLKNPRDGTYFQMSEQGLLIWKYLDGQHTLRDLTLELLLDLKVFAPDKIVELIDALTEAGFVDKSSLRSDLIGLATRLPIGARLVTVLSKWLNCQATWSGVDRFFSRLHCSGLRLLFTPGGVAVLSILAAVGLAAGLVQSSAWLAALHPIRLEHEFALLTGVIVSILSHELSHGLAVKSFGREVPRVGIGWHWIAPMVFVDTSDIWLAHRRARVWVSLSGPFANLVIAGVAAGTAAALTPSQPVLWQLATINLVLVIINLTPLLELDGYYTLMDLFERPRLRSQSWAWLLRPKVRSENLAEMAYLATTLLSLMGVLCLLRAFL